MHLSSILWIIKLKRTLLRMRIDASDGEKCIKTYALLPKTMPFACQATSWQCNDRTDNHWVPMSYYRAMAFEVGTEKDALDCCLCVL